MKQGFNYRIKITPAGPLQQFDDKAIDLTKKPHRSKRGTKSRKSSKRR